MGQVLNLCSNLFKAVRYWRRQPNAEGKQREDFPSEDPTKYEPLIGNWEKLYTRRIYHRIQDCFNRPISSSAGVRISMLERVSSDRNKSLEVLGNVDDPDEVDQSVCKDYNSCRHLLTTTTSSDKCPAEASAAATASSNGGSSASTKNQSQAQASQQQQQTARKCLNLCSYDYLGFADDWNRTCGASVKASLQHYPVSCSLRLREYGMTDLHRNLERNVASFLGKEDAMILNMGYNMNATTLPATSY